MTKQIEIKKMRDSAKNILVASFYKETQVGRSIGLSKKKRLNFSRELLKSIIKLRKLVDNEKITNTDIRNEIRKLSERARVSIGQSQKVINVYLKFYCLFLGKPEKILKELDCPLDSTTMGKKQRMKYIRTMSEYIEWQRGFLTEENFNIRLLKDREYDENRIKLFKQGKLIQ
jgi:hypothetical protein